MKAPIIDLDLDTRPVTGGWIVALPGGKTRCVFRRKSGEGWAVFTGDSTDREREPALGYSGSWRQDPADAIAWARTHDGGVR